MNDILSWKLVSIRAGSDKSVLSFQRGYIPVLQVMHPELFMLWVQLTLELLVPVLRLRHKECTESFV